MGTDLIIISNHAIEYSGFDFDRLGREIAARLNQVQFPDDFYLKSYLRWRNTGPATQEELNQLHQCWQPDNSAWNREDFYATNTRGKMAMVGPYNWTIEVWPGYAQISLLPFRYWQWMGEYDASDAKQQMFRTRYREALAALVGALGGNEVVYLADNGHPLEAYWDITHFAALTEKLLRHIGPPRRSYQEMRLWYDEPSTNNKENDTAYWLDDFSNLTP